MPGNFMRLFLLSFILSAALLQTCTPDFPEEVAVEFGKLPAHIDYNLQVKPILSDKCFACHGPDKGKRKAGLRLDVPEIATSRLSESGNIAIDPGHLNGSELFRRIISADPEYVMPAAESHLTLSAKEKAILIRWIEEGAAYKPHWAFVKPHLSKVPDVETKGWAINPIDNFILQRLEGEGLKPSRAAEKELLLRRVSLDLTGLPPSLEELDAFLRDTSSNAYEKQVDRLLNSPHYGEKMATHWLDLARFADSHGYTVDRIRDMSPYRDWVIDAFNNNLPFDQFIQWQLAGDLMPNPTKEMIVATAFNRNHPQNMEGGIVEEEFQTEYVVDRTNTFGDAFLALSLQCARCHDHKFDPITQKNYYEVFSFFNNVKEAGQISWNDAMPTPTLMLPTEVQQKTVASIKTLVESQERRMDEQERAATPEFERWLRSNEFRRLASENIPHHGLVARYTFDDGMLNDHMHPAAPGVMRQLSGIEKPSFEKRGEGKALALNGDVWLDLNKTGVFRRSEPFTIGISVNIPGDLKEGVIFHKCISERLYNFRGYHLYLKNDRLEVSMAHTAPSNAITMISKAVVPRDKWIQLTLTYDGSSKARGLQLFIDGEAVAMEVVMDQLTKDIIFRSDAEPGLQIGAWDRGYGFKEGKVDDVVVYNRALTPFEVKILADKAAWPDLSAKKVTQLSRDELHALRTFYCAAIHPASTEAQNSLRRLRTVLADSMESIRELMVMQEMPTPRKTYILQRGNYNAPLDQVFPNTPASVFAFSSNLPRNRYGLAQWLTDANNPLTARVAVNRFWQYFFGTGIVKTSENFGSQGEFPSHPELLDWLAIKFLESGWNVKAMNKLIAMSATYRQDSRTTATLNEKDPDNRWLARGPSFRMSAEMIRDNALAASGLLNEAIGGKSVRPYQPDGLWQINNARYVPDNGDAVYRRSLYVLIKRSVPNPTLATFDAGSRSYCVARRQTTNTPLQALVTLNDPTFIEAARTLGATMAKTADRQKAIQDTYRKLTGRTPSGKEVDLLQDLLSNQLQKFREHPGKAKGWLRTGQYVADKALDPLLVAAYAVVASTILNSDATLTKR
jgi:hypothetical protein